MLRTRVKSRSKKEHPVTHSELGCAPIWAFQELTAVGAAKVLPDTLWLLLILLERRSTKASLHDRCRMHGDQPRERRRKIRPSGGR